MEREGEAEAYAESSGRSCEEALCGSFVCKRIVEQMERGEIRSLKRESWTEGGQRQLDLWRRRVIERVERIDEKVWRHMSA